MTYNTPSPALITTTRPLLELQYGKNPTYYLIDSSVSIHTTFGKQHLLNNGYFDPQFDKYVVPVEYAESETWIFNHIMIFLDYQGKSSSQLTNVGAHRKNGLGWFIGVKDLHKVNAKYISKQNQLTKLANLSHTFASKIGSNKQAIVNSSIQHTLNMNHPTSVNVAAPTSISINDLGEALFKGHGIITQSINTEFATTLAKYYIADPVAGHQLMDSINEIQPFYKNTLIFLKHNEFVDTILSTLKLDAACIDINTSVGYYMDNGTIVSAPYSIPTTNITSTKTKTKKKVLANLRTPTNNKKIIDTALRLYKKDGKIILDDIAKQIFPHKPTSPSLNSVILDALRPLGFYKSSDKTCQPPTCYRIK